MYEKHYFHKSLINGFLGPHVRPELFRPSLTCPPNVRLEANYQVPNFDKIRQSATNSFCQDLIICEKFPELARIIFPKSKLQLDSQNLTLTSLEEPKVEPIIRRPSISLDNIPDSHSDNELFSAMFSKPPSENDFSSCASPSNSGIHINFPAKAKLFFRNLR